MSDITKEMANVALAGGFGGAEYNAVAKGASLEGISLFSTKFEVNPECLGDQRQWKLNYGRKILSCQFSEEDHSVVGIFEYFVTAKLGRKRALNCVAHYGVFYETPEGATDGGAKGFCRNVGTFAAYPYFRALFAQLVAEAGLNLPPLPAIASMAHIPPKESKKD
jgi:hypothetical protein